MGAAITQQLEATYGKRAMWLITGWISIMAGIALLGLIALLSRPPVDSNERIGVGLGVAFLVLGIGHAVAAAAFMQPDGSWRRRQPPTVKPPLSRNAKRRRARKARRRGPAA